MNYSRRLVVPIAPKYVEDELEEALEQIDGRSTRRRDHIPI